MIQLNSLVCLLNSPTPRSLVCSQKVPNAYFMSSWIIHHISPAWLDCTTLELYHIFFIHIFNFSRGRCFSLVSECTCQRTAFSDKNNRLICSSRESTIPQKIKFYIIRSNRGHKKISLNQSLKQGRGKMSLLTLVFILYLIAIARC